MVTLFQLFTLDKWYAIILSLGDGMDDMTVPVIYCLLWILLGSFIFRNIFVGVMGKIHEDSFFETKFRPPGIHSCYPPVNNFQNIRQEFMEDEQGAIMDEEHLDEMELNVFALHEDL